LDFVVVKGKPLIHLNDVTKIDNLKDLLLAVCDLKPHMIDALIAKNTFRNYFPCGECGFIYRSF